jgi:hypothetical protein
MGFLQGKSDPLGTMLKVMAVLIAGTSLGLGLLGGALLHWWLS